MAEAIVNFLSPSKLYNKSFSSKNQYKEYISELGIYFDTNQIEVWLDNFKINYRFIDEITDNSLTFIPFVVGNQEKFFEEGFFKLLNKKVVEKLRDKNSKIFILFLNIWEATGLHEYRNGIARVYLNLQNKLGIHSSKLLWVSNDLNIRHNIKLFNLFSEGLFPENLLDGKNFFGLDMFESKPWTKEMLKMPKLSKEFLKEENKKIKKKYALSKTGKVRKTRLIIANHLINNHLLDKTFFSWIDVYRHNFPNVDEISLNYIYSLFHPNSSTDFKIFLNNIRFIDKRKPWVLDLDPNAKKNFKHIGFNSNIDRKFLADSYATIVTETNFDELKLGSFFITEKTYQQFAFYHPFILVGESGLYSYIRENGYETFPELFDESFDKIFDPKERMKHILQSLDKFYKTPKNKLTAIVSSDYFIDKLIHNRDNLEKRVQEKKYIEFRNWLLTRENI